MALITAATEPNYHIVAFATGGTFTRRTGLYGGAGIVPLDISPRERLDDVIRKTDHLPFGGTDCALPWIYAQSNGISVDCAVTYTDSETWANPSLHPTQALGEYRRSTGINDAAAVIVGMVSNGFSIADPRDSRQLDVVGFDAATPSLIAAFSRGEF
jgi:60 kDa SS-A/Ro ribonucleoprotein